MTHDNPNAFPGAFCVGPNDDLYPATPGMTLRDYFAGQALTGLLAQGGRDAAATFAEQSFACADAMLAARAPKGGAL